MRQTSRTLLWQAVFSNIWVFAEHRIWPYGTGHIDNGSWQHTHPDRIFVPSVWYIRYIYVSTCSISLPLKYTLHLTGFPKHMIFVLVSLTIIWLFTQNVCNPSSCFCIPCWVSENSIRSSAHNRWAIISSDITTPYSRLSTLQDQPCIYETGIHLLPPIAVNVKPGVQL